MKALVCVFCILLLFSVNACTTDITEQEVPLSSELNDDDMNLQKETEDTVINHWMGDRVSEVTVSNIFDFVAYEEGYYVGDGFSLFIETPEMTVLFDTPYNDNTYIDGEKSVFVNMKNMDVAPDDIDSIVLSHSHGSRSIKQFMSKTDGVVVHGLSDIYMTSKVSDGDGTYIINHKAKKLADGIYLTGPIEGSYDAETILEQALVVVTDEGLLVFLGCSHPGIEVMLEHITELFKDEPIHMIYGGLHLRYMKEDELISYIELLEGYEVQSVALTHCSGKLLTEMIMAETDIETLPIGSGSVIRLP